MGKPDLDIIVLPGARPLGARDSEELERLGREVGQRIRELAEFGELASVQ